MELPYNKIIEEDCLGGLMVCTYYLSGDPDYDLKLTEDDFYLHRNKLVFTAILQLHKQGMEPWENNVKDELQRMGKLAWVGGREFIHHLIYCALSRPGFRGFDPFYTAPILRSLKLRRDALIKAQTMAHAALDFSRPMQVES